MKTLYISDLDGTLLNSKKEITGYSKEKINNLTKGGELFSVATARTAGTVTKILKGTDINCPVILMNGAMVYDLEKEKYINYEVIEEKDYLKVAKIVKEYDINGFIYTFDGEKIVAFYEKITEITKDFFNERKNSDKYKKFVRTESFYDVSDKMLIYFALMDTYEKLSIVNNYLEDMKVAKAFYKDTYNEKLYYLEIFSQNASKGNGVKFLKEHTGADKVIAFGDNLNDLDMFKEADICVAPENAVKEVKEKADFLCEDNNSDGVIKFIERRLKNERHT